MTLYIGSLVDYLNFILLLCNQPIGPGNPTYECMYNDLMIATLKHELKHAVDQEGENSEDGNEWEKLAYCCEFEFWCSLIENDPDYGAGGAKACFGQAVKNHRHNLKDLYSFLAGPLDSSSRRR